MLNQIFPFPSHMTLTESHASLKKPMSSLHQCDHGIYCRVPLFQPTKDHSVMYPPLLSIWESWFQPREWKTSTHYLCQHQNWAVRVQVMVPPKSPVSEKALSTEQVQNSPEQPHDSFQSSVFYPHFPSFCHPLCVFFSLQSTPFHTASCSPPSQGRHICSPRAWAPQVQCSQEPRPGCHTCMPLLEPLAELPIFWQACKNWWLESPENSPISDKQIFSANAAKINNALKKPVSRLCLCMKWHHQNRMFDSIRPFNKSEVSPWERTQWHNS